VARSTPTTCPSISATVTVVAAMKTCSQGSFALLAAMTLVASWLVGTGFRGRLRKADRDDGAGSSAGRGGTNVAVKDSPGQGEKLIDSWKISRGGAAQSPLMHPAVHACTFGSEGGSSEFAKDSSRSIPSRLYRVAAPRPIGSMSVISPLLSTWIATVQ